MAEDKIHAGIVADRLYSYFANYMYKLFNAYIFNWESDFYCMSKSSGYSVECEIKVSRGDFKKDFEKEKHRLFADTLKKRTHHVYRTDTYSRRGDILIKAFKEIYLRSRTSYAEVNTNKPLIERNYGRNEHYDAVLKKWVDPTPDIWKKKRYVVNDWQGQNLRIEYRMKDIHAPTCGINIKPMKEIICPHQFYFACPAGLIKKEELPDYAGLLWIEGQSMVMKKKAPYMHKRPMDLRTQLLSKFYHLWVMRVDRQEKIDLFEDKEAGQSAEEIMNDDFQVPTNVKPNGDV